MPASHRIVHAAINQTTPQGISELSQQKRQEAEWARVRSEFREPTLSDYRRTVTVVSNSPIDGQESVVTAAGSTLLLSRASNMTYSTVEVFEGPSWLRALREKKQQSLAAREPFVRVDPTSTLDELVRATTSAPNLAAGESTILNSTNASIVSLSGMSPLRAVQGGDGDAPPLLNEETCAWKRCLWLQQQHQRQQEQSPFTAPEGVSQGSGEKINFIANCAWMRSLEALKGDEVGTPSPQ